MQLCRFDNSRTALLQMDVKPLQNTHWKIWIRFVRLHKFQLTFLDSLTQPCYFANFLAREEIDDSDSQVLRTCSVVGDFKMRVKVNWF